MLQSRTRVLAGVRFAQWLQSLAIEADCVEVVSADTTYGTPVCVMYWFSECVPPSLASTFSTACRAGRNGTTHSESTCAVLTHHPIPILLEGQTTTRSWNTLCNNSNQMRDSHPL